MTPRIHSEEHIAGTHSLTYARLGDWVVTGPITIVIVLAY